MSTWSQCLVLQLLVIVNGGGGGVGGGSGVQRFVTAERVNVVISCFSAGLLYRPTLTAALSVHTETDSVVR